MYRRSVASSYSIGKHKNVLKIRVAVLGTSRNVSTKVKGSARWSPARIAEQMPRGAMREGL
eukprot:7391711-Prymnesium_polylepis.4